MSAKDDLVSFHTRICAIECNNNDEKTEEKFSVSSGATSSMESHIPERRTHLESYNDLRCEICVVEMNSPKQAQYVHAIAGVHLSTPRVLILSLQIALQRETAQLKSLPAFGRIEEGNKIPIAATAGGSCCYSTNRNCSSVD